MKKYWYPGLLTMALLISSTAQAQQPTGVVPAVAGQTYQFMQFTVMQGMSGYLSFAPEFQGQKIIELKQVYLGQLYNKKERLAFQANEETKVQWLQNLSAAGWELVQVSSQSLPQTNNGEAVQTHYLLRKAK